MTRYVDASAVIKLYVEEPESPLASELLAEPWTTARHTFVEVRRALAQILDGKGLASARERFADDWDRTSVVELDVELCERAAAVAERTGVRTLDALHLAAAQEAGAGEGLSMVTFDHRLASAARLLGWTVLGAR